MSTDSPRVHPCTRLLLLPVLTLALVVLGCGPSEEATDEEWETSPEATTSAPEYRLDSLQAENRRMQDQLDALVAENRSLRARIADLETRLSEATSAAQAAAVSPAPISPSERSGAYQAALDQFMSRSYDGAIRQFESLLQGGVAADLEDNCHYWIGESRYALRQYAEALQSFEKVLGYPNSGKRAAAQLMIGNTYAAMGNPAEARDAYNKVISDYPTSSLTAKAQEKLSRLR